MKFVDVTPTWVAILPTWLMMYRQAVLGNCANPDMVKENAVGEFTRMAEAADKWNAHVRELEAAKDTANG